MFIEDDDRGQRTVFTQEDVLLNRFGTGDWRLEFNDDPVGTSEIIIRNSIREELLTCSIWKDYLTVNESNRDRIVNSQTSLLIRNYISKYS